MNAGDAHENERLNKNSKEYVPGALDAQGKEIKQAFADTAAMNYADAKYNDGNQYTGSMSFMDYLRTQYNSAYGTKEQGLMIPGNGDNASSSQGKIPPPPAPSYIPSRPRPPELTGGAALALAPPAIRKRKPGTVSNVRFTGDISLLKSANRRLPRFDTTHNADKTT